MKQKKWVTFILLISILFINGCDLGVSYQPVDNVIVNSSTTMTSTEEVSIQNCYGSSTIVERVGRKIELTISGKNEVVKTKILAQNYSVYQNQESYIDVTALPGTNIKAEIVWYERVETGSYSIDGETGSFVARIPIIVELAGTNSLGCSENNSSNYPQFPWPPPQPSAFEDIDLVITKDVGEGIPILSDVDDKITEALLRAGYYERSYWEIPNGFVIATQLERIYPDGFPFEDDRRWENNISPIRLETFSLSEYINALFSAPRGYYRVFVFIVTTDIIVPSGMPISQAEAETFGSNGASGLPTEMVAMPYTSNYTCLVYVYEFIQSGIGEVAQQNLNNTLTGRNHLYRAGLLPYLEDTP